ncbi:MAG: AAA family ATPase, partial [Thermoplasmataceae archaeon]
MYSPERLRPTRFDDLIIPDSARAQIVKWAEGWKSGIPGKKCLILFGPPGVGKTTAAIAISQYMGVPCIEMNASDERNADSMKRIALMGATYRDLMAVDGDRTVQRLILIDEADNIFESRSAARGGDAGGLTELAKVVRETRNPVVITLNDFYSFRRKAPGREIIENSETLELRQFRRK